VRLVSYLQRLYRDARSTEHKNLRECILIFSIVSLEVKNIIIDVIMNLHYSLQLLNVKVYCKTKA